MAETDRSLAGVVSRNVTTRELRHEHPRRGWALGGVAALVLLAMAVSALRITDVQDSTTSETGGTAEATADRTVAETIRWVAGLDAGTVLPTDVTGRLAAADAGLARSVTAAWRELRALRPQAARVAALAWLAGLANKTILPTDVVNHLEPRQQMMAATVTAVWAEATEYRRSGLAGGG